MPCGIAGYVGYRNNGLIRDMCEELKHRGPDDDGYYEDSKISLGMRRLSIIDLSTGQQPLHNEDETVWVISNGEIYNYVELRAELEAKGHTFHTRSDTETIAHLYEETGHRFPEYLRGMFATALWDLRKQKLFIARDRFGKKPLFYAPIGKGIIFASEIKSILTCEDVDRTLDPIAIQQFLTYLYIPAPRTVFKNVKKLLPSTVLEWSEGKLVLRQFWNLRFPAASSLGSLTPKLEERISQLIADAVRIRLRSDVPIGAFLSGGLDSSIVAALAKAEYPGIFTFSVGFEDNEESEQELRYARELSEHLGTSHYDIIVDQSSIQVLPLLVWHFDEPFADMTAIPNYFVSQLARHHVKVALSGDGADESFAGYHRFGDAWHKRANLYRKIPMLKQVAGVLLGEPRPFKRKSMLDRARLFNRLATSNEQDFYIIRAFELTQGGFTTAEQTILAGPELGSLQRDPYDTIKQHFVDANATDVAGASMYVDFKANLADDFLARMDRTSMAVSLEVRCPFLDHVLVEQLATIPYDLKVGRYANKEILRRIGAKMLPREILRRRKTGFLPPTVRWLGNDEILSTVASLLTDPRTRRRGLTSDHVVLRMLELRKRGETYVDSQLWALVVLELWHRIYVDVHSASERRDMAKLTLEQIAS